MIRGKPVTQKAVEINNLTNDLTNKWDGTMNMEQNSTLRPDSNSQAS